MPQGSLDYQIVELGEIGNEQAVRKPVDLGRAFTCFTVVFADRRMDDTAVTDVTRRLHLTQGDEGIPIHSLGQTVRVPAGLDRIYYTNFAGRFWLLASDGVDTLIPGAGVPLREFYSRRTGFDTSAVQYARVRTTDQEYPGDEANTVLAVGQYVFDESLVPPAFRALTTDDLAGAAGGGDELVAAGSQSLTVGTIHELIAAPGAGNRIVIHSAYFGGSNSATVLYLQDEDGPPANVLAAVVGPGGVAIPPGSRVELPENDALDMHNEIGSTTTATWTIVYSIEAV